VPAGFFEISHSPILQFSNSILVISSAMIRTELFVRLGNSPGALEGVCRLLANERVNILALMLESTGQLRLIVDNHTHAAAILREHHHTVTERDVIVTSLPNEPGALASVLRFVTDANVNIEYAYCGVPGGAMAAVVLGVDDAMRAAAAAGL